MTLEQVQNEFEQLDIDFRNVPNRDQAVSHERRILLDALKAIADGDVKQDESSKICKEILARLRFI